MTINWCALKNQSDYSPQILLTSSGTTLPFSLPCEFTSIITAVCLHACASKQLHPQRSEQVRAKPPEAAVDKADLAPVRPDFIQHPRREGNTLSGRVQDLDLSQRWVKQSHAVILLLLKYTSKDQTDQRRRALDESVRSL